jgi:hypothetical protein
MPRFDGNTNERKSRHHKGMHSAAHGKGHDSHLRRAKQENGTKAKPDKPDRRFSPRSQELAASLCGATAAHRLGKAEVVSSTLTSGSW